jgi:hypothetical protein
MTGKENPWANNCWLKTGAFLSLFDKRKHEEINSGRMDLAGWICSG